ncbi:uncharacterized protein MONOS_14449 [Monocercomonoides exilis]|uniref:uncharacterized protein n=1 Tax=Monocercomonoides exilis TaxID=2049356 RepID=UPI0035596A8F|nr:hypothetical protein MONOS_14449 [Monocercomonoides exilis]
MKQKSVIFTCQTIMYISFLKAFCVLKNSIEVNESKDSFFPQNDCTKTTSKYIRHFQTVTNDTGKKCFNFKSVSHKIVFDGNQTYDGGYLTEIKSRVIESNSTIRVSSLRFSSFRSKQFMSINALSKCEFEHLTIVVSEKMNAFPVHCHGLFHLFNVSFQLPKHQPMSSLSLTSQTASLRLSESTFSNNVIADCGSILHSGCCNSEDISKCSFFNITQYHLTNTERTRYGILKSTLDNCQICDSANVIEGVIICGTVHSSLFSSTNSSFMNNMRIENLLIKRNRLNATETQFFKLSEWINETADCGGALYVYDNPDATLTVLNSSFSNCEATKTYGGGIFSINISEVTTNNTVFHNCSCAMINGDSGGGGVCCSQILSQVIFSNSLFKDCWSGNDGGGLSVWYCACQKQDECIIGCLFDKCSGNIESSSAGGGCDIVNSFSRICCNSCSFSNCVSKGGGGGLLIGVNNFTQGLLIFFCFFHNNVAQKGGHDIVLDNADNNRIDGTCFSTRTTNNRVSITWGAIIDKSEWLLNNFSKFRFVASTQTQPKAKDTFSCGLNESYSCLTISHCLTQMIVGFVEEMKVLSGTVVEGKEVVVGGRTISVNGVSPAGSAIETRFESNGLSLFCVGTGELSVSDLSVIHNSSVENNRRSRLFEVQGSGGINLERMNISMDADHSEERSIQNSLVEMEGGELKMKDVRWSQTFSTTSVMSLSQGSPVSLSLDNCTFSNIVRTTAGSSLISVSEWSYSITLEGCTLDGCGSEASEFGGGMMVEVGNVGSLTMNGGVVRNCYVSTIQGRGGGIGLKVRDIYAEFQISSGFEGNRAKWGSDIFVDSINLESTAKSERIACLTASFDTKRKIQGYENGDESFPIPMCVYLIPLPDEIFVSNVDAFDYFYCGFAEVPCQTLSHCLTRQEEEKKIVVDGKIEVKSELMFDSFKHTIRGKDENSGWKVIDDSDGVKKGMITVDANTNLKSLVFSVPSALPNHESFFSSASQSFSLEICSLTFQDSQSALSYVFLSTSAGKVSVSSLNVLSLTIGNCPLISLDGSNAAGTFTSMSAEDMSSTENSVLFGVANGASFSIKDSTFSVKASSQTDLPSGTIRVISTNSAKLLKLTNNTMSGFRGIEGNGGAMGCTLGRDCSLEIVGGMMSGCESNGGNGGGLWVEMKEGSSFTVGNMTDADQMQETTSNDEGNVLQLLRCKATQTAYGERGYGGGIYLHLDDGASSFILKDVSFSGCDAREGKEIFINSYDLSSVISIRSIVFNVDLNNYSKLNGFERSTLNETFAIPLVVYLWDNFSGSAFVGGGSLSYDFSKCGYESFPCPTIAKAASVHFEGKKKDITILESFAFEDELSLRTDEWSFKGEQNEMKCGIADQKEGMQNGLIENTVVASVTGIIFSLIRSLSSHESVFECHSRKLTLNKCGMEGGADSISTVFVKAVGGAVEVSEFSTKDMRIGDSSFFIVDGSVNSRPSLNMTNSDFGEITFGNGCVVECHNGNIEEISGCTFLSISRSKGSGGCISVSNKDDSGDFKVEINDCTFEGCAIEGEGNEIGGGAFFYEASASTNLLMNKCKFYCCSAPYEGEGVGHGGGIMLSLLSESGETDFVISSPTFSSDKPNNARFGKDLFVASPSLISSIKNETLPFVKDRLEILTEDSMRGYDGGNRECAIPLIYFWKEVGSSVHVAREGNNVVVCGLLEYPCGSADYGVKRGSSLGIESIAVQGTCDVRSEMSVGGMRLEGINSETDKIMFVKAIEGYKDAVVECEGVVQFKEVGILIPTAFDSEANILIQTGTDSIKTTIAGCLIHMSDNAEGELTFVLISASKGIVEIENTNIAGFSTMHEIMSISADCVIIMSVVTFEEISSSGKSAIAMSESDIPGNGNDNAEEEWNIQFEQCSFLNVKHSVSSNPSYLFCDVSNEVRLKMENSTIDKCGSTSSNEGGGMFFLLNELGRLEMNHTNVTDCFCSNNGRGGGIFLKSQSATQRELPFVLSNITFKGNAALKGRDVFVKCTDLDSQISESQFLINFGEPFVKDLAIWGCTADNYGDEEDLLGRVYVFRSEFIFVSSIVGNNSNSKNCGEMIGACSSLNVGVSHIIPSDYSQLFIWNKTTLTGSCSAQKVTIKSMEASRSAEIKVNEIDLADEEAVRTSESVRFEKVSFVFGGMQNVVCSCLIHQLNGSLILESVSFSSESRTTENSQTLLDCPLLIVENGIFEAYRCSIGHLVFSKPMFQILNSEGSIFDELVVDDVPCKSSVIECGKSEKVSISKLTATNISLQNESLISFENGHSSLVFSSVLSSFTNISRSSSGSCIICISRPITGFEICNCSFRECSSNCVKGSQVTITLTENVLMDSCTLEGSLIDNTKEMNDITDEMCRWNSSIVDFSSSSVMMKDTTICNSSKGGITVSGGSMMIEKGELLNNNPSIERYPSLRRNIICSDSASLSISSLKGGDGVFPDISMWILNEGCLLEGIVSERASPFFIPVLESVEAREKGEEVEVVFKGKLLLPCSLSFMVVKQFGEEKQIEKFMFDESGYVSETEVEGRLAREMISEAGDEAEVRVSILFGDADKQSSTDSFILKNRSELKANGDERIVEGGKEGKSYWLLIVCIVIVVILFVVIVVLAVRWRKQKSRTEELEEIVNDNIRKDPKLIEMVTMEMSPEEQWRRAENEAEKKNDVRMKKRVYAKSLEHSESSEHLLSESGSTEYILGKDSDKIPEWALEKVEEEEIRKQTPSPSISSTCSTDSDSTFVRGEDLCPTTSSMSNLVDAMACSSPHEKLIVDLRDSLFMLLHGLNKTKEMAIGTLKEREQTAAQILFWVANLALHSFDEIENPLQSLSNLSPHIVLFSEHMVICIVMHSDLLSDDDSDSSSISSSTVVTSASGGDDDDEEDSLPSSAFEDEDSFKKECLRWKAPELQMKKKMGATKESVSFSIGMMLWECLTLQIPFGEYEAEVAGQKIMNGERPKAESVRGLSMGGVVEQCLLEESGSRTTLVELKREFIKHFPVGAVILTVSDAIGIGSETDSRNIVSGTMAEESSLGLSMQ